MACGWRFGLANMSSGWGRGPPLGKKSRSGFRSSALASTSYVIRLVGVCGEMEKGRGS